MKKYGDHDGVGKGGVDIHHRLLVWALNSMIGQVNAPRILKNEKCSVKENFQFTLIHSFNYVEELLVFKNDS